MSAFNTNSRETFGPQSSPVFARIDMFLDTLYQSTHSAAALPSKPGAMSSTSEDPSTSENGTTAVKTRKVTFMSLPLELRQAIYLGAAGDVHKREVHVAFALSGHAHDESGILLSPVLDLISSLHKVSEEIHREALEHLTSFSVCWVLVSNTQPHKYLMRALQRGGHSHVLRHVARIRFARVTVMGHTQPVDADITPDSDVAALKVRPKPAYLEFLGVSIEPESNMALSLIHAFQFRIKVESDIGDGFNIIRDVFPTLRQLNIELDIFDWVSVDDMKQRLDLGQPLPRSLPSALMFTVLITMGYFGVVEIHVCWKDFGYRGRIRNDFIVSEEFIQAMQGHFLAKLKAILPVRIIVCDN